MAGFREVGYLFAPRVVVTYQFATEADSGSSKQEAILTALRK
jgi:hypothetical protein